MPSIRVTQGMSHLEALAHLQRNFGRLFADQRSLSSGLRVQTASDDPDGAARILEYARRARGVTSYRDVIASADLLLDDAATELQAIGDGFHQVRERVVQALNGTQSDADRATLADELDQLLTTLLAHANGQSRGGYLFGGSRTDAPPFERVAGADGLERVVYRGDGAAPRVEVSPGVIEAIGIPGSRFLDVGPRGATQYAGSTGVRAGAGTDSGVGRARLVLTHTATGFGAYPGALVNGASGVRGGASSNAGDTILGFSHTLELSVNGAATGGVVSLNGGPPLAFTSADTDFQVTGPNGDVVHLDLSGVVAGFNGTVALNAYGTASFDGGQTTTALNFGLTAQSLTNPVDGSVTWIDATGITRAGAEDVTYGGTLDLFNSVLAIRDLLRRTGTPQDVAAAVDQARALISDLDAGHDAILRGLSEAGAVSQRLLGLDERLGDVAIKIAERRSEIEDVDLSALIASLKENEAVYESSLLVSARIGRISLNNFLG